MATAEKDINQPIARVLRHLDDGIKLCNLGPDLRVISREITTNLAENINRLTAFTVGNEPSVLG